MKRIKVKEGNTGILYITHENGSKEQFIPNYNLDDAHDLLIKFYKLKDSTGTILKNNYMVDKINWFPTVVSYLYWNSMYKYVQYESLLRECIDGKYIVEFENKKRFYSIYNDLLLKKSTMNFIKRFVYNLLIQVNNKRVTKRHAHDILFYRYGLNDFRTTEIKKTLDGLDVKYLQVISPSRKELTDNIFRLKPYYFIGGNVLSDMFQINYNMDHCSNYEKVLFTSAVTKINEIITSFIHECRMHSKILYKSGVKTFYGLDDANNVYPVLYACKKCGIKTIAHQHGAYAKRNVPYIMDGFELGEYEWYDHVIVWGRYWRDLIINNSKAFAADFHLIGSNKHTYSYFNTGSCTKNKNILIPYEFLANTYIVGKYMQKLIDLGYTIYFKARPDEDAKDELDSYCLSEECRKQIIVVADITDELMARIDIVAGTQTALIYDLLPYNKETWIFETEFKLLYDLVEQCYARLIRYEDLDDNFSTTSIPKKDIDPDYFCNPKPLKETITEYVLSDV